MSPRGCDGEREALSLRAAAERPLLRIVCVRSLHTGFNLDRTALMTMRCCMRGPGEGLNVWALSALCMVMSASRRAQGGDTKTPEMRTRPPTLLWATLMVLLAWGQFSRGHRPVAVVHRGPSRVSSSVPYRLIRLAKS